MAERYGHRIWWIFFIIAFLMASVSLAGLVYASDSKDPVRRATNPQFWPPALNRLYPDMELVDQDGAKVRLSSFKGKIIIVEPIGMSCPACQAFAGASRPGAHAYGGVQPQSGLKSFEEYLQEYVGTSLSNPKIVFVQLILYNQSLQAPSPREIQAWAKNFGMSTRLNRYVLAGQPNMVNTNSYNMIPGFQLIDQRFVLRSDATGHNPQNDLFRHLFPTLKTL
ncbi:MAG: hypothetical protein K2Z81_02125, partial [Cyanobacteria bacterium]|nr:hypothetical protein [Cyanobacteriota bacterium]